MADLITLHEKDGKIAAVFRLTPSPGGFPAEFPGGETFKLGWLRFWNRRWVWTNETGEQVLTSTRSTIPATFDLVVSQIADPQIWPILATLELALKELSRPWFGRTTEV
jgi:hypothetical protein